MPRAVISCLLFAAVLIGAPAAVAATQRPHATSLRVYQDPSGPGTVAVIATVDLRGFARARDLTSATRKQHVRATLALSDGSSKVVASDRTLVHPLALRGHETRFDFRIPSRRAAALDTSGRVRVRIVLTLNGREAVVQAKARRGLARQGWGTCTFALFCPVVTPEPVPAPSVGFGTGDSSICLAFGGSGYASPFLYQITVVDSAENLLSGPDTPAVQASGAFTDTWNVQPAGGYMGEGGTLSVSGSVPAALLSAPPTTGTGPLVAGYAGPPLDDFGNPITLPYSAAITANDC